MWTRHEARPTTYGDIQFRSGLEAAVAREFDRLGVEWAYEEPVDGVRYLPDFTIYYAPEDLDLPRWVEVKPADLLYSVRDHFGAPERFDDDLTFRCSSDDLKAAGIEEIWKPKKLAELVGEGVLVVSKIARNRSLSVSMWTNVVVLSRSHPCVNHRQVELEQERAEEQERRRIAYQRQREQQEAADRKYVDGLIVLAKEFGRPARYGGWCVACHRQRDAEQLVILHNSDYGTRGGWLALCREHLT